MVFTPIHREDITKEEMKSTKVNHLSEDLEDATKEHLDLIYTQNKEGCFSHNMERFSWYNTDETSIQCLRALPKRRNSKNDVFIEAVRCILGLPSYILQPFADGHHSIGRNATLVDAHANMVKNAMLINGDYLLMHASIQSLIIDSQNLGYSRAAKHVSWPCPS